MTAEARPSPTAAYRPAAPAPPPAGSIVSGDISAAQTQIFTPASNAWAAAGPRPPPAGEDGWVTLPDGSVVSMSTGGQYRYNPSSSTWITLPPAPSGYANGGVDPATTTL